MALSDRLHKSVAKVAADRASLAAERVKSDITKWMQTDQFKLAAASMPEGSMNMAIAQRAVEVALDPVGQYQDCLRNKGFRPAEIRQLTHRLYLANCVKLGEVVDEEKLTYDVMLPEVANFFYMHQELYNGLNPEELRKE